MRRMLLLIAFAVSLGSAANILVNPSFEVWMDTIGVHLPLGWLTSELLHPGSAQKDSNSHSGDWCVRLTGGDTAAFVSSVALVREGFNYWFSGYARCPGVLGGSFVLQFLGLLGGLVGEPQLIPVYYSGTNYRGYSRWVTAPDSAVFLSVSCATLPGAQVYVDDVTLDDTTVQFIHESVSTEYRHAAQRRLVVPLVSRGRQAAGRPLYDCLGRRVCGVLRPGVYFLPRR